MCTFATRNDTEFNDALRRFVDAQAGLIAPRPGRTHFDLNRVSASQAAETRAAPGFPQRSYPGAVPGAATAFNLDACFTMAAPVDRIRLGSDVGNVQHYGNRCERGGRL